MNRLLLAAAVLLPAAAGAVPVESLSAGAERAFLTEAPSVRASVRAESRLAQSPLVLETPSVRALGARRPIGLEAGRVDLAAQLDQNLFLMKETLGARLLDVGVAVDPGAKSRFLTFTDGAGTALGRIGSLGDLRDKGVDIRIDAATVYNFRVEVGSIFDDPVRKSILYITPVDGTVGPSDQMTTGRLLDVMHAKSALVTVDGTEYEIFYGRDALSDGSGFAGTRSFLFTHVDGLSTKAWPLAESALPLDVPTVVTLGDADLQMTRTSGGQLIVGSN
ncbi:MAG TPA: hypothetical protein VH309_01415 [Elusimicrobiota bacterium]|jgi:hypothetical protein|nr:hypothetical protein [Elusimicrobiota bacterium]